jgi:hypothetical protein
MVGKIASRLKNNDSVRLYCDGLGAQNEHLHETFWKIIVIPGEVMSSHDFNCVGVLFLYLVLY